MGSSPGQNCCGTTENWVTARSAFRRRLVSKNNVKALDIYGGLNEGELYHPHCHPQMEEVEAQERV